MLHGNTPPFSLALIPVPFPEGGRSFGTAHAYSKTSKARDSLRQVVSLMHLPPSLLCIRVPAMEGRGTSPAARRCQLSILRLGLGASTQSLRISYHLAPLLAPTRLRCEKWITIPALRRLAGAPDWSGESCRQGFLVQSVSLRTAAQRLQFGLCPNKISRLPDDGAICAESTTAAYFSALRHCASFSSFFFPHNDGT